MCENFKVGGLARYGLDYESLSAINPRLIYCSITGFRSDRAVQPSRAGYDFLVQGMGGIMSLTGFPDEEGGRPTKVGVGIADVMCGMYAASAILAALHARQQTGKGQYIDVALFDSQIAWLINQGLALSRLGEDPPRRGNGHPHIVPYDTFPGVGWPFHHRGGQRQPVRPAVRCAGPAGVGGMTHAFRATWRGCATAKR